MRQKRKLADSLSRCVSLLAALLMLPAGARLAAAAEAGQAASAPSSYEEISRNYFLDRSLDFAGEMLLKEGYLSALYECTNQEIKARHSEGLDPALLESPLWNLREVSLDREDSSLAAATIGQRYRLWVDAEEKEYQRNLGLVQQVRTQLIKAGTEAQNQRMFKRELKRALTSYGKHDWDMARLLFDRLLEDYHYQQVDDILYYQAQTCMQLGLMDRALEALQQLIAACPGSPYRAKSYDQASAILESFGNGFQLRKLYGHYQEEAMPGKPEAMGGIHVRTARAEIGLGHYEPAVEILTRVSPKSSYYLASKYLLADCYTALENWPKAIEVLTSMAGAKQKSMPYQRWRMLRDEAALRLAFIYYQSGNYEKASDLFDKMRSNSPFYDRVVLGKAWIAFQVEDYEAAIKKSEEMLKAYPLSTEIYEANSLAGYCCEQLGRDNEAAAHFLQVLDAGAGRADLQSFQEERRRISESMADLQALEEEVFSSGDEMLFNDYKRARNQLWVCSQRIGLAELLQVNSRMKALVEERVALDSLIAAHAQLEKQVSARGDQHLVAEFLNIEDRIWASMDHLKVLGQEQAKTTPLYYKEAQVGYINARADSLAARLEAEINQLDQTCKATRELQQVALAGKNLDEYVRLGLRLDHLDQTLDLTGLEQTQAENSRRPALHTRVDRWSDFSFNRYAMGGMNLEQLDRKYERMRQVDEFIATLDEMIEQKKGAAQPAPTQTQSSQESSQEIVKP